MADTRNTKIDFIKGLLILGIVWGHFLNAFFASMPQAKLHMLVRTYDLPFFMLIGGYLLAKTNHKYSPAQSVLNKISKIARPTVILGGFFGIITYIILRRLSLINVLRYVSGIWFMWSYFFCAITVSLLTKCVKSEKLRIFLFLLIQAALHLIPGNPWNISYMFPYFVIGFYICEYQNQISQKLFGNKYIALCCFIAYALCFYFWKSSYTVWNSNGVWDGSVRTMLIALFRFTIGIAGCACAYYFMSGIYKFAGGRVKKAVAAFGQESMIIYIVHSFLVTQCFASALEIIEQRYAEVTAFIAGNRQLIIFFAAPVLAFITCCVIAYFSVLLKKSPFIAKHVFGLKR